MDLKKLRFFVAVAETLHFRQAAGKLGISQPPLTMAIKSLEMELGVDLFQRNRRSVVLTPAGKLLLEEARDILRGVDRAIAETRRVASGDTGRLRIGSTPSSIFNPIVPEIIRSYRTLYPGVDFSLSENNTPVQIAAIRSGNTDGAFIRPTEDRVADIEMVPVLEEEMLAAIPSRHRLATQTSIALADLRNETIILRPRPIVPRLYSVIVTACEQAGFSPIISQHDAPQMISILSLVAAELGITFIASSMSSLFRDFVEYRPVSDLTMPKSMLAFARSARTGSAPLANFERLVVDYRTSRIAEARSDAVAESTPAA